MPKWNNQMKKLKTLLHNIAHIFGFNDGSPEHVTKNGIQFLGFRCRHCGRIDY